MSSHCCSVSKSSHKVQATLGLLIVVLMACDAVVGHSGQTDQRSVALSVSTDHVERMKTGLTLFRRHVREWLVQHCLDCHGGKHTEGELNLATREGLLKGGSQGPAAVPRKSAESLLMQLIRHRQQPHMPHEKDQLPQATIEQIATWIDNGAPYVVGQDDPGPGS